MQSSVASLGRVYQTAAGKWKSEQLPDSNGGGPLQWARHPREASTWWQSRVSGCLCECGEPEGLWQPLGGGQGPDRTETCTHSAARCVNGLWCITRFPRVKWPYESVCHVTSADCKVYEQKTNKQQTSFFFFVKFLKCQGHGITADVIQFSWARCVSSSWLGSFVSVSKVSFHCFFFIISVFTLAPSVDAHLFVVFGTIVSKNSSRWRRERTQLLADNADLRQTSHQLRNNYTLLVKQRNTLWKTFCGEWNLLGYPHV